MKDEKRVLAGLEVVQQIRKLNDSSGVNITRANFKVGKDVFKIKKYDDKKHEYSVKMNGEYVRCAEDNSLCRNDGRCLHCGYCM